MRSKEVSVAQLLNCSGIVESISCQMRESGYNASTLTVYSSVWKRFLTFSGDEPLSEALIDRYLQSEGLRPGSLGSFGVGVHFNRPYILCAMRAIYRYAYHDQLCLRKTLSAFNQLPDTLRTILIQYQHYCEEQRRHRANTCMRYVSICMFYQRT